MKKSHAAPESGLIEDGALPVLRHRPVDEFLETSAVDRVFVVIKSLKHNGADGPPREENDH